MGRLWLKILYAAYNACDWARGKLASAMFRASADKSKKDLTFPTSERYYIVRKRGHFPS